MKRALPRLIFGFLICSSIVFFAWMAGYIGSDTFRQWVESRVPTQAIPLAPTWASRKPVEASVTTAIPAPAWFFEPPLPSATPTRAPEEPLPPGLSSLPADELGKGATYHNAILFTSRDGTPFRGSSIGSDSLGEFPVERLWLMKLDTLSAAVLTPPGLSSAVDQQQGMLRFIDFGAAPPGAVQGIAPPAACVPPDGWNGDLGVFTPCTNFRFSTGGDLLGYEIPIHGCASQLHLLDLKANTPSLAIKDEGHFLRPLSNGRWLYATGSCGEGQIFQYDPRTNKSTLLGPEPLDLVWNPQRSAFFAHVSNDHGQEVALWGYSLDAGQVFFSMSAQDNHYNSMPTWSPDGQSVIFQYNKAILSEDRKKVTFYNPRHLIRVDVNTRAQSQIADLSGDLTIVPGWLGDHLMIWRYPFQVQSFDNQTLRYADDLPPVAKCVTQGKGCAQTPDLLAYNYLTGKLTPWYETGLPAATATPGYEFPALDLDQTLYEDPGGAFRVVLGPPMPYMPDTLAWQGYASLWYLPRGEEPILWVESGRGFQYVP